MKNADICESLILAKIKQNNKQIVTGFYENTNNKQKNKK